MKHLTLTALAAPLALAFCACGGGPTPAPTSTPAPAPASEPVAAPMTAPAAAGPDRSAGPPLEAKAPVWHPPAVSTWQMPNGMTVWYLQQTQAPLMSLQLVFPHGASADPKGKEGLTALTADMLDEGAGDRSALELSEAFQRLATDYGAQTATDAVIVSLDMLAENLGPSLELLVDVLRHPKLPADEFARRKDQRMARALASEADPHSAATVALRRALFGDGYGGRPADGVRGTIETLTLTDVRKQYKALFQPQGVTIVAVGAVDAEHVKAALDGAFGDWKGKPVAKARTVSKALPMRAVYLVDFPGSSQSMVTVARRVPGVQGTDDEFAALLFNWPLGGAFSSRLNLNLREDKGYTYGARAGFNRWRAAGFYGLSAGVKADTTRPSIDEMLKELAAASGDRPITAHEREEAVGGLLLGFPGRFESMGGVAGQLAGLVLDQRPPDWYRGWPERVQSTTLEEVNAAAKRWAGAPDAYIIVVAGDRTSLEPTLASLGLPILPYDAQGSPLPTKAAAKSAR